MQFFHPHAWTDDIAPISNIFLKYHMSKHHRTCVNSDANNNKKVRK